MSIDYAIEHLWLLTSAVYAIGGGELKTPRYVQFSHPEKNVVDNRTAQQIIDDLLENL